MNEGSIYLEQIKTMSDFLTSQTDNVPEDKLNQRPAPHSNPVGWNYWHLLRIWDLDLNWVALEKGPTDDAWVRGNLTEKSGYDPTGKGLRGLGLGVGYSDAEVDEIQISQEILREYHAQLIAETEAYLNSVSDQDIRRNLPSPFNPDDTTSPSQRMQHTVAHSSSHIGELRYAKGLLGIHDATYPGSDD